LKTFYLTNIILKHHFLCFNIVSKSRQ